jgi:LPS-assembly lipoprotein
MWWRERLAAARRLARVAPALCAAASLAGCFEPLYGQRPSLGGESIGDRLSSVEVAQIPAPQGTPQARIAVAVRNALLFDLTGGAGTSAATHRLNVSVDAGAISVIVDVSSGRANAQVSSLTANYALVELATGKTVLQDSTFARVSYDIPGSAQRFAKQRAELDAQDRAVKIIADNIRNRLASYFVAGT